VPAGGSGHPCQCSNPCTSHGSKPRASTPPAHSHPPPHCATNRNLIPVICCSPPQLFPHPTRIILHNIRQQARRQPCSIPHKCGYNVCARVVRDSGRLPHTPLPNSRSGARAPQLQRDAVRRRSPHRLAAAGRSLLPFYWHTPASANTT
jgi:hypothetical protein